MKKNLIPFLFSGLLLYLVLRKVDFLETWKTLGKIDSIYLAIIPVIYLAQLSFRNLRWHAILNRTDKIAYRKVNSIAFIGLLVNNILPARIGELVKVWIVSRRSPISRSAALTSVILDRLFDGLTVVLILIAATSFYPTPEWIENTAKIGGVFFIVAVLVFFLLVFQNQFFIKLFDRYLTGRTEKFLVFFHQKIRNLLNGMDVIKSFPMLTYAILISFVGWIGEGAFYYGLMLSFGFNLTISAILILTSIVALSIVIPSTPGYIGVHQFAIVQTLLVFGIGHNQAFGVALIAYVIQYVTILLAGIVSIWTIGISWKEIYHKKYDSN